MKKIFVSDIKFFKLNFDTQKNDNIYLSFKTRICLVVNNFNVQTQKKNYKTPKI
jgi:hypothetical protein